MIRDNLRDEKYFQEYIENKKARKQKYIDRILKLPNPENGFKNSSTTLDLFTREILLAKYSSGMAIRDLVDDYLESIKWFQNTYNSKSFTVQMIWMLSLGILLDIEDEEFQKLVSLVQKDNPSDLLIDLLINQTINRESAEVKIFKFDIPYKFLEGVIFEKDKSKAMGSLKEYLTKKWFQGHKSIGSGWTENVSSKHNTYAGYWSFESAALVKILDLDDSSLKDQQYYPYDMVHWKD